MARCFYSSAMPTPPFHNCDDFVETQKGIERLCQTLRTVCAAIHPQWSAAGEDGIQVEQLMGGVTNLVYKVTHGTLPPLLVRVYGANTEFVIDRDKETTLLKQISDVGFSVPYYGNFGNGRVEGFRALRSLTPEDFQRCTPVDVPNLVARQLAAMHSLRPTEPGNPECAPLLTEILWERAQVVCIFRACCLTLPE